MQKPHNGFTLIELLVVIAIIAILAAILFPVFAKAKSAAKKTMCLSHEKQLGMAFALYAGDSDGSYPNTGDPYLWVGERFRWPLMPYLALALKQNPPSDADPFASNSQWSMLLQCPEDSGATSFNHTSYAYSVAFYESEAALESIDSIKNLIKGFNSPGSLASPTTRSEGEVAFPSQKVLLGEWTNNHDYSGGAPVGLWGTLSAPYDTPGADAYSGSRNNLFADTHAKFIKASRFVKKDNPKLNAPDPNLTPGGLSGVDIQ